MRKNAKSPIPHHKSPGPAACPIRSKRSRCSRCFRERAMPEKITEHTQLRKSECGMRNVVSEARASARAYLRIPNLDLELQTAGQSRYSKPSTTPSAEAASTPPIQGGEHAEFQIWNLEFSKPGIQNSTAFHLFHDFTLFQCFNCFKSKWLS